MSAVKEIVVDIRARLAKAESCPKLNEVWKSILENWENGCVETSDIEELWSFYIRRLEECEAGVVK